MLALTHTVGEKTHSAPIVTADNGPQHSSTSCHTHIPIEKIQTKLHFQDSTSNEVRISYGMGHYWTALNKPGFLWLDAGTCFPITH
jgi:hypothetical protein